VGWLLSGIVHQKGIAKLIFYGIRVKVSGFFFLTIKRYTWQIVKKKSKQTLYYYGLLPNFGISKKIWRDSKEKKSVLTA
jgi:hypothetical protein